MDNKEDILPLDDELMDYLSLSKHLKDDTERKKKQTFLEFEENGDKYLNEIEKKKKTKELKQIKLIPYILKHNSDKYTYDELMSYSFEDIQDIYNGIKKERRSVIIKIFHFLFNIE